MTRILVQRGSSGSSSSSPSRSSSSPWSSSARAESQVTVPPVSSAGKDEESGEEVQDLVVGDEVSVFPGTDDNKPQSGDFLMESLHNDQNDNLNDEITDNKDVKEEVADLGELMKGLSGLRNSSEKEVSKEDSSPTASGSSYPPPPPVPPPRPSAANLNLRNVSGNSNAVHVRSPGRGSAGHVVSARTSQAGSRPSSPRSHNENEGYNSADEQSLCFVSSYDDLERERQFEIDITRAKGYKVKRMAGDGNCLFRAVADQVYGDPELYDLTRQMCMDYMERERDHFSQFITEGFMSYCKRKRRDKVYGNNVEIQAMCEIYNRPIHIYSCSTGKAEPVNIFQGSYNTDTPPIRLSYHQGNHYNSLVDPRRSAIGAGLGFSCLRGTNVDKDQVKAAIKAQQDLQIDNALVAEGRFCSDLELTEKEIERTVMEVSRAEYLANEQLGRRGSSTLKAEPSSSGARSCGSDGKMEDGKEEDADMSSSMQVVLSMGFGYMQVIEAFSIFGDDVDSVVCYLLETGSNSRRKGKAAE